MPRRPLSWIWILIGIALASRFAWIAIFHSGAIDLYVYWKSVQDWLHGISFYEYKGREGAIIFKYPPWMLPFFLPLAVGGFQFWHWLWVPLQLLAILYCVQWVIRAGVHSDIAIGVAFAFWWIWLGHAQAGQFTLFILVAALWAVPLEEDREVGPGAATFLTLMMSSKVFNLFSLLGLARSLLRPRIVLLTLAWIIALNALVIGVLHAQGNSLSLIDLYREWIRAGSSGGLMFNAETIRGQGNHGFTAAILRLFKVPAEDSSKDIWVAGTLGIVLSAIWFKVSRDLSRVESWVGWIGVGVVISPLLWQHSFVLVYPLCAIATDRAIRSRSRVAILFAVLSVFFIGLLVPNLFLGADLVRPFELLGSKSWGVALGCAALVLSRRPRGAGGP